MKTYAGSCFCGAVAVEVEGEPAAMGYCHCQSCRSWSASPVNAFVLWKPEQVKVTKGAEHIGTYRKTLNSERQFCRLCGGHLMTNHPPFSLIDVFSATIPDFPFRPQLHVNYAEAVLQIRDGLLKLKDFPAEMGGSGETLPE
ncbi:MAG TPA: GFA family protein [Methylocella sp.]|nr:GFA family protein [Methylocella sp.]